MTSSFWIMRRGWAVAASVACFAAGPALSIDSLSGYLADCNAGDPAAVVHLLASDAELSFTCGRSESKGAAAKASDRFLIASVSKTYLAVSVLQLWEQGALGLDDLAIRWLPASVAENFVGLEGVTLRHLLTMTSGLPDYLDQTFTEVSTRMALSGRSDADIMKFALARVEKTGSLFEPGDEFDYSNTNYLLLQLVLEKASGVPFHRYLSEQIFEPAGLKQTDLLGYGITPWEFVEGFEDIGNGLESMRPFHQGFGMGDGGLVASAADVARFYQALFADQVLLTGAALDVLLEDFSGEGYGMGLDVENIPGLGLVVGHSGGDLGFSADVRHALDQKATAVALYAEAEGDLRVTIELLEDYLEVR